MLLMITGRHGCVKYVFVHPYFFDVRRCRNIHDKMTNTSMGINEWRGEKYRVSNSDVYIHKINV